MLPPAVLDVPLTSSCLVNARVKFLVALSPCSALAHSTLLILEQVKNAIAYQSLWRINAIVNIFFPQWSNSTRDSSLLLVLPALSNRREAYNTQIPMENVNDSEQADGSSLPVTTAFFRINPTVHSVFELPYIEAMPGRGAGRYWRNGTPSLYLMHVRQQCLSHWGDTYWFAGVLRCAKRYTPPWRCRLARVLDTASLRQWVRNIDKENELTSLALPSIGEEWGRWLMVDIRLQHVNNINKLETPHKTMQHTAYSLVISSVVYCGRIHQHDQYQGAR